MKDLKRIKDIKIEGNPVYRVKGTNYIIARSSTAYTNEVYVYEAKYDNDDLVTWDTIERVATSDDNLKDTAARLIVEYNKCDDSDNVKNILDELKCFASSLNGNMYRFDKKSNFINYEQWFNEKVNSYAETLVKDFQSKNRFKRQTNYEIIAKCRNYRDGFADLDNDGRRLYYAYVYELQRRNLSL